MNAVRHLPDRLINPLNTDLDSWKSVLPSTERFKAIQNAHILPQSGHLGIEKTFASIAEYYYWPGFYYDTQKFILECTDCQLHKPTHLPPAGLLTERIIENPCSCVIKFVEIRALKSASAKSIWQALDELVINGW